MIKNTKVRRLFADIETSPTIGLFWGAGFGLNISHENILVERRIICIAYKWEHEDRVVVLRWDAKQNDRSMLEQFVAVANTADEIVGHYGNHFDWPWIRTRVLLHKLPPVPIWKTVDTKALASRYFYFQSNKLDYISNALGHGRKLHTDFQLWKDCLNGCEKALNYMCKYCGVDVKRLEAVYHDLMAFVPAKTHAGVVAGSDKWTCPRCGSKNVRMSKKRITANGTTQYQFQCQDDGGFYTVSKTAYENYVESKSAALQKVAFSPKKGNCVCKNR